MTYVTGFFLVFAGMLIGYFLWYRDRTEDEKLRIAMDREAQELRSTLKLSQSANSVLEERFTRQKGQLNVLQQLCDDWSTSREQSERDRAILEVEVEDKRKKHDSATSELQRAKEKQIELEDKIHALTQQHLEKTNKVDQDWHKKHALIESKLTQRNSELKSTVSENGRLVKSLHQTEATIAELKSEIEANKKLLDTATKNAGGLKREYVSLESSLKESSDLLKQSRAECATALSEKKVAEQSLASIQGQLNKLQSETEKQRDKLSVMKALEQDVAALKASLSASQEQLEKVTLQRELAMKAEKSSVSVAGGLQSRLDNQESTIHGLREKHKDALEQAKRELQLRADIESKFEKQKLELTASLNEQKKQVVLNSAEITLKFTKQTNDLQKQVSLQSAEIQDLTKKRDALFAELKQVKFNFDKTKAEINTYEHRTQKLAEESARLRTETRRIGELEKLLTDRDGVAKKEADQKLTALHRISELEKLLTERQSRLKHQTEQTSAAEQCIEELEKSLAERNGKLNLESKNRLSAQTRVLELESEVKKRELLVQGLDNQLKSLREQYETVQLRQTELQTQMDDHTVTRQQFESLKQEYAAKIEILNAKLKSGEETIRQLRRERAGVLARLANYRTIAEPDATIISFKQAMQDRQRTNYDQEYGGHTEHHELRGLVYTTEPETSDDLKLISGIAEVLEARLNDFGIYTFKQIMEWKPGAIEEFSRLLAFRDRIQRDDWKGQAQRFYQQKLKAATKVAA